MPIPALLLRLCSTTSPKHPPELPPGASRDGESPIPRFLSLLGRRGAAPRAHPGAQDSCIPGNSSSRDSYVGKSTRKTCSNHKPSARRNLPSSSPWNGFGESHRGCSWTCQQEGKKRMSTLSQCGQGETCHPSKCHSAGDTNHRVTRVIPAGSHSLEKLTEVVPPREGHHRAVTARLEPLSTLCSFIMGLSNTFGRIQGPLTASRSSGEVSGNSHHQQGCHGATTGTCG